MKEDIQNLQCYIGKRLRERRQTLGLSLFQIASKINISEEKLKEYKCGHAAIHSTLLYQIASILNVDFDYFFEGFSESKFSDAANAKRITKTNHKQPLNVLLINDNENDIYFAQKAFESCFIPVAFSSMQDGRKLAQFLHNLPTTHSRPDVILLELHLTNIDGKAVLHALKQDDELSDIPVIILSGSIHQNDICSCYQHYCSGYMYKTFDYHQFEKNIQNFTQYWGQTVVLRNRNNDALI